MTRAGGPTRLREEIDAVFHPRGATWPVRVVAIHSETR